MNRYLLILFFVVLPNPFIIGQSVFTQLQQEDGLPSNKVFDCIEDSNGFLWFASNKGVAKYDGENWMYLNVANGLPDNDVLTLMEDSKKRIWFVPYSGELSYYFQGKLYTRKNDSLLRKFPEFNIIASLYEGPAGKLWVNPIKDSYYSISEDTVLRYAYEENVKYKKAVAFNYNNTINYISIKPEELTNANVFKWNESLPNMYDARAYYIDQNSNQCIYLTEEGIVRIYSNKSGYELILAKKHLIDIKEIGALFMDASERLWVTTVNDGVYVYSNLFNEQPNITQLLKNKSISAIEKDTYGNMWITSLHSGVYKIPYDFSLDIAFKDPLRYGDKISCFKYDRKNTLWVGTDLGFIYKVEDGRSTEIKIRERLNNLNFISSNTAILEIEFIDSKLLIRTDNSIVLYDLESDSLIKLKTKFMHLATKDIVLINNKITVSHSNGLLDYTIDSDLDSLSMVFRKTTYCHTQLSDGSIWYANKEGLYRYENNIHRLMFSSELCSNQRIFSIEPINDSTLILSTNGAGLFVVNTKGKYEHIGIEKGLHSMFNAQLYVDSNYIWTHTNYGIDRIKYVGDSIININSYLLDLGNKYNKIVGIDTRLDSLFVAVDNEIIYYNYDSLLRIKHAPKSYIQSVAYADTILHHIDSTLIVEGSDMGVGITCGFIDYNRSKTQQYRYRLNGQTAWKYTQSNTIEFSSLDEGAYNFEFSVSNDGVLWSKPSSLPIRVVLPLWEKQWFVVLVGFLISSLVVLFFFLWIKRRHIQRIALVNQHLKGKSLEQRALQSMMNPHFIFNVLNSIKHSIRNESKREAQESLTDFASLIRIYLEVNQNKFISIEEELEYLNLYLSMESKRFDQSFHFNIRIDEAIDPFDTMIPTMLIQPFVENAIWHGLIPQGGGDITISFHKVKSSLRIHIFDNGIGIGEKSDKSAHNSLGIKLTKERFSLMQEIYKKPFFVEIKNILNEDENLSGTKVEISIPDDLHDED